MRDLAGRPGRAARPVKGEPPMEWMIMPLKRYADFSGRSCRQEYWMFILLTVLVYAVGVIFLIAVMGSSTDKGAMGTIGGVGIILLVLLFLGLFIPTLAVQVRRFHDQDMSGWMVLLQFIPYVGGLIIFVFMCLDGTAGPNRFGPDPKGRGDGQAEIFA
jgi:uncharacterized membrane protein YhaH (DUF805 family)